MIQSSYLTIFTTYLSKLKIRHPDHFPIKCNFIMVLLNNCKNKFTLCLLCAGVHNIFDGLISLHTYGERLAKLYDVAPWYFIGMFLIVLKL